MEATPAPSPQSPDSAEVQALLAGEAPTPTELGPDLTVTDLKYFYNFIAFDKLDTGAFTRVRVWSRRCLFGRAEKYAWRRAGEKTKTVVAKIMENDLIDTCSRKLANDRAAFTAMMGAEEDALTEIGVYRMLQQQQWSCQHILQMHGVFRDAKWTWLVLDNCEGGDMMSFLTKQVEHEAAPFSEEKTAQYLKQVLRAVHYLHSCNIAHRDISLENLLIRKGELRLMDFGQAVLLRAPCGEEFRYFRMCGKDYYRAPECHLPAGAKLVRTECPANWRPGKLRQLAWTGCVCTVKFFDDSVPGEMSTGEVYGYTAGPVDAFACAVVFYILHTRTPPWRQAIVDDPAFRYFRKKGIATMLNAYDKPLSRAGTKLLKGLLRANPFTRWTIEDGLASTWFQPGGQEFGPESEPEQPDSQDEEPQGQPQAQPQGQPQEP